MSILFNLLIFLIILFLYIHVQYQLKTSNDLEFYSFEELNKNKLFELQELRQPIIFNFKIEEYNFKNFKLENLKQLYKLYDINVKDISKTTLVPINLENGIKLLKSENKYISVQNHDFLEESKLNKILENNDTILRPELLMNSYFDIIMGCKDSVTCLEYSKNFRNYLFVSEGKIKIKLTIPNNRKYLDEVINYDSFKFESLINIWNVEEKYKNAIDRIKFIELDLEPGRIISIPAYWWYSIKFLEKESVILSFSYRTYMNSLSILPSIFTAFLQEQNTKFKVQN